jgi:hypothetical protein
MTVIMAKRSRPHVTFILVLAVVVIVGCHERPQELVTTYKARTHSQLSQFRVFVEIDISSSSQQFPSGGVDALEEWLNERCENSVDTRTYVTKVFMDGTSAIVRTSEDGHLQLIDAWGHSLVYKYPSGMPGHLFRLYSVGPNGIDEDGKGDDIDPVLENR